MMVAMSAFRANILGMSGNDEHSQAQNCAFNMHEVPTNGFQLVVRTKTVRYRSLASVIWRRG